VILDLDDVRCTDPAVAGGKGAVLARARRMGLPVLPGVVVSADVSRAAMILGSSTLRTRGSGGARSVVFSWPLPGLLADRLADAAAALGEPLIVRSSSVLEGDGSWSGAFTSYERIGLQELEIAVRGCWASAFSSATLARMEAVSLQPGASPMAVLVQPSIEPVFGGTARLVGAITVITAVEGSPAPLVQGWASGVVARVAPDGAVSGATAIALLGEPLARAIAETLMVANERAGATGCEWASTADGAVLLLQLSTARVARPVSFASNAALEGPVAQRLARLTRRSPGPLGEALILGWAVGERASDPDEPVEPADVSPDDALRQANALADQLLSTVWRCPAPAARHRAHRILQRIRGTRPARALAALDRLATPDPDLARALRALAARVRFGLVEAGEVKDAETAWYVPPDRAADVFCGKVAPSRARVGVDPWEPFNAAVVLGSGRTVEGTGASPGIGYGRLCLLGSGGPFRPRDVVVVTHPVPSLGAMLWDAAGLVTLGGGPAAHLFEAARSVGVPAVCGAPLDTVIDEGIAEAAGRYGVALDGDAGLVAISRW
jgi:hypothetical protein